jgi:hypothetical protein
MLCATGKGFSLRWIIAGNDVGIVDRYFSSGREEWKEEVQSLKEVGILINLPTERGGFFSFFFVCLRRLPLNYYCVFKSLCRG